MVRSCICSMGDSVRGNGVIGEAAVASGRVGVPRHIDEVSE